MVAHKECVQLLRGRKSKERGKQGGHRRKSSNGARISPPSHTHFIEQTTPCRSKHPNHSLFCISSLRVLVLSAKPIWRMAKRRGYTHGWGNPFTRLSRLLLPTPRTTQKHRAHPYTRRGHKHTTLLIRHICMRHTRNCALRPARGGLVVPPFIVHRRRTSFPVGSTPQPPRLLYATQQCMLGYTRTYTQRNSSTYLSSTTLP